MRWLWILLVVLGGACGSSSTKPAPAPVVAVHVDRRVELFALLHRLAGSKEYLATPATSYVAAVDAHFAPFKEHAAVLATRELRQRGIGYDAPMWLAVQLDDKLRPRDKPGDARWDTVDVEAYLAKVRDFATASGFDAFLAKHADYHRKVETRLRTAITEENPVAWFDGFFGARPGAKFIVAPSMLVGTHNFGPHTKTELYQVIGVVRVDFDELPTFDDLTRDLVVHEMAHSYINPLFEKHAAALAPHGARLFQQVAGAMQQQAYPTWTIMLNEQGVRAVTALYLRERKSDATGDDAITAEERRGFKWTKGLVDVLARYRAERQRFSDLDAFMPHIIEYFAAQP